MRPIRFLGDIFAVSPAIVDQWPQQLPNDAPVKQGGLALLRQLYAVAGTLVLPECVRVAVYLLEGGLAVVLAQLADWLYAGQLAPLLGQRQQLGGGAGGDFFVALCHDDDEEHERQRDDRWWQRQFRLSDEAAMDDNWWLGDAALRREMLRCGKSVRLLAMIEPGHAMVRCVAVVGQRPELRLLFCEEDVQQGKEAVRRYRDAVEVAVEEALRSGRREVEERRDRARRKTVEAEEARRAVWMEREGRLQADNDAGTARRRGELDRLRASADEERERRRRVLAEEKAEDKLRMQQAEEGHDRRVVDELR